MIAYTKINGALARFDVDTNDINLAIQTVKQSGDFIKERNKRAVLVVLERPLIDQPLMKA